MIRSCASLLACAIVAAAPADPQVIATEGVVHTTPAGLWKVLTTAEGVLKLGVGAADIDFRPGGLLRTAYDPKIPLDSEGAIHTEIVAFDPERVLVTRIHRPPKGFPFMNAYKRVWTVFTLTPEGPGATRLRVAMVGYGPDEESQKMKAFFERGNAWTLKTLQEHFPAPR